MICLALLITMLPFSAAAQTEHTRKVVRVGWYDSSYNQVDASGRKTGYSYEYQRKLAAYTGWTYEYVEGSWAELFQKLKDGEIDLMSGVTYTEERTEQMLFPDYKMGSEEYYIYISADNADKFQDDYTYFNGKSIGVNKGTVQAGYFKKWAEKENVHANLVELALTEGESVAKLLNGKLDGFITLDTYFDTDAMIPVAKIGYSDIYFAVSRERSDLLEDLNMALRYIQNENRFYNDDLYAKYVQNTGVHLFADSREKEWLTKHGAIKVGYLDNYLAFCAKDEKTGELTGALKDFLEEASGCLANIRIDFKTTAYPTMAEAMRALKNGEIDCIFPANYSVYDGEKNGIFLTLSLTESTLYTLVRSDDNKSFTPSDNITTAVEKDNLNYGSILLDHYPDWNTLECDSIQDCIKAVSERRADCFLISSYRYNNLSKLCEQYHLIALDTGNNISFSIAVNENNTEIYSILDKIVNIVPETTINMALTQYFSEDQATDISFFEFVRRYLFIVIAVAVLIVAMLMMIIFQRRLILAEQNAKKHRQLADDLSRRVYVDALTSVRNKGGYDDYIRMLQERLECREVTDFAICMFDCDDLKIINDKYGHDKGDEYLKTAVRLICRTFQHSPVFRLGGDEFCAILQNEDLQSADELKAKFISESNMINSSAKNDWEKVNVSIGIARYDANADSSVEDTASRADKIMYENKRKRKTGRDIR